jgi:hypothetical protein
MANRPTSYALHLRPLFTEDQRQCMLPGPRGFDLTRFEDVRDRAELIFSRLDDRSMPADDTGPWPDEWIQLFRRWIDEGCQP